MKRIFIIGVAIFASIVLLSGCGKEKAQNSQTVKEVNDTIDYAVGKTQVEAKKNAEKTIKEIEKVQQQKINDEL